MLTIRCITVAQRDRCSDSCLTSRAYIELNGPTSVFPTGQPDRCKQAAMEWAQRELLTEPSKLSVPQRLKLLKNFS